MGWTSEPRLQSFEAGENQLPGSRHGSLQVGAEMIDRGRLRVYGGQSTVDGGRWTASGWVLLSGLHAPARIGAASGAGLNLPLGHQRGRAGRHRAQRAA
jgi:hypothetical protein